MSMAEEIETKFAVEAFEPVREALVRAGAERLSRRFEENVVLDTPDGDLRHRDVLLRLRRDASARVTLKLPAPAPEGQGLKVRQEIETEVADPDALQAVFFHLGYRPFLRYEKVRETWRLGRTLVCLDQLPFGLYLEIEGPADAIPGVAARLGLAMDAALADTYHALYRRHLAACHLPPADSFVFDADTRLALLADLSAS
ncbi:adenylyl cyclase CyaB [Solidesulfovibrio carbinoliphilus subsp. oakridgensis]|uniref:Adenylyl cyclase CyaB n=1 Tax=Solidesulfovibrio carbinoliphilus subsp. oakridgensis TaxID=694327 RepID=G7QE22_9BACT|nr:class IV adenylate cyclase [Solidesulfovibrio carbinoliphilus]EHJ46678.1 adenylyl cyclase CyaB [Solidesulfovibrio carbinoliphilus subsp. oakridgensis]